MRKPKKRGRSTDMTSTPTKWIYTVSGEAKYYQNDDYIYSKGGTCEFSVNDGWWQPTKGGVSEYHIKNGWVYTKDGKPAFYYA